MQVSTKTLMLLAAVAAAAFLPAAQGEGLTMRSLKAASCTTEATNLISACPGIQSQASAFGGNLETASDAQIQQVVKDNKSPPNAACCQSSKTFFTDGCSCDPTVLQLSAGYKITAKGYYTLFKASELACADKGGSGTYNSKCPTSGGAPAPAPAAKTG